MEKIKREIRLFLVSYGRLFAFIIGCICVVIFVIQTLNSMVIKQNNEKISSQDYQEQKDKKYEEKEDKEYISQFIDYCNQGKIEEAYNMLSDRCKKEKYSTIESFKEEYVNKIFDIKICKYNITKSNDIYIATLTQDMIITGKADNNIEVRYKIEGVLERKIYIDNIEEKF